MAKFEVRMGRREDAEALCQLANYAGEGLALYVWEKNAAPGQNGWDVGMDRVLRADGAFSYRKAYVVPDDRDEPAACLMGYTIGPTPEPIPDDMPELFVPLQELENEAPNSWYVNILACQPESRSSGIGSFLLGYADRLGREAGCDQMSLIVKDSNLRARELYERLGYRNVSRRPLVQEDWQTDGAEWLLMLKPL